MIGEPTNKDRAEWGKQALDAFAVATGSEPETIVCDLLADLMHYCRLNNIDFEAELHLGERHFDEEVEEEKYYAGLPDEEPLPLCEGDGERRE